VDLAAEHFTIMPKPVNGKIFMDILEKGDLLREKRVLVLQDLPRERTALIIRDYLVAAAVTGLSREMLPGDLTAGTGMPPEHMRVDPADRKPAVIDPASGVLEKPAGSIRVAPHFQRVTRDIENAVLVAEFRIRCRFKGFRIDLPCPGRVTIEQEDMIVYRTRAAPAALRAPEPARSDCGLNFFEGVFKKVVAFLHQRDDAVREGEVGGRSHHCLPRSRIQISTCRNGISIPSALNRSSIRELI
jgi:hypothetical protein